MALKDWIKNVSSEVSKAASNAASRAAPKGRSDGRGARQVRERHSVGDLIALGRVKEAEKRLQERLKKNNRDHHARLNLADLLFKTGRRVDAVEEYMFVADGYAADGFGDKAHALLTKLERWMPDEPKLRAKITRLDRGKELEHRLSLAQEALLEDRGGPTGPKAFTIQQATAKLPKCSLLEILTPEQIQRLFRKLDIVRFDDRETLVKKGEEREELFILLSGEIAAEVQLATGGRTVIRSFTSSQVIGESALLSRKPWPADYSVLRKVVALKLDRTGLEGLLPGETDPRGFLDALRSQNHDAEVVAAIAEIKAFATSEKIAASAASAKEEPTP